MNWIDSYFKQQQQQKKQTNKKVKNNQPPNKQTDNLKQLCIWENEMVVWSQFDNMAETGSET